MRLWHACRRGRAAYSPRWLQGHPDQDDHVCYSCAHIHILLSLHVVSLFGPALSRFRVGVAKLLGRSFVHPRTIGPRHPRPLHTQLYALRMRWEWLHSVWEPGLLGASTVHPVTEDPSMFSASVTVEIGDGASARLWTDAWRPEGPIRIFTPNLFATVDRRRLWRSVKEALTDRRWVHDITGAHTTPMIVEYLHLWERLMHVQLKPSLLTVLFANGRYSV